MVQLLLADPKPTVSMDVVLEEAPASLPPVIAELVAIQICSAKSVEETCVMANRTAENSESCSGTATPSS